MKVLVNDIMTLHFMPMTFNRHKMDKEKLDMSPQMALDIKHALVTQKFNNCQKVRLKEIDIYDQPCDVTQLRGLNKY